MNKDLAELRRQLKLQRLLRLHRQHVFDDDIGIYHHKALLRLKKTKTFKAYCEANRQAEQYRAGERLARMGY